MYKLQLPTRSGSYFAIKPIPDTEKRVGTHKIRHMNFIDIQSVKELANAFGVKRARLMFGEFDIAQLWSKSYLSILLENSQEVVATMILNNYPNLASIPTCAWEQWVKHNYEVHFLTPDNTLWVHLFLFKQDIRHDVTNAFLQYVFKKQLHVKYIIIVVPPYLPQFAWLSAFGSMINSPSVERPLRAQRLLLIRRTNFVSSYTTRRAVMGDNDDIVALLDRTCPRLKELYGKHYVAAILSEPYSNRAIIVAEYKKIIVAAMIVNSNVNYQMLNYSFHLEMLSGLRCVTSTVSFHSDIPKIDPVMGREKSISDFTLRSIPSGVLSNEFAKSIKDEELDDDVTSVAGLSEIYFDIDLDDQSVDSIEVDMVLGEEKSDESLFIGHLEINMSCVVLSYTHNEIQRFMQSRKTSASRYLEPRISKSAQFSMGEANAFSIEAIGVAKSHAFAVNLLFVASYECFPTYDYCLLSLPCNEPTPPILKKFIRAHTRRDVTIPHELYICHKLSVFGKFYTREACMDDTDEITDLIGPQRNMRILDMFSDSLNDLHSSLRSYVFLCNSHVVGFAILDEEHDLEYITSHFYCKEALADIQVGSMDYGRIMYFTILPIFEKKAIFFLQELHRLSQYLKLFFLLPPKPKFVPCIILDMTLALPIQIGELKVERDRCYEYPTVLSECRTVETLFVSTPFLCSRPKFEINTRIVVVGAGEVGLSFVIALLVKSNTGKQAMYNNITIVSAHGVNRTVASAKFLPITSNINKWTLDMHGLFAYVDVVEGVMTGINRKEKTISVSNNKICYDILILTCGVQFQIPKRFAEQRRKRTENPENVFVINTEVDSSLCLDRLKRVWVERQNNVVVYGHSLNAFCCIQTLLHMGLPEKFLVFIDYVPPRELKPSRPPIFTDPKIEEAILTYMTKRGVRIHRGYLYSWDYDECERIKSVTFECCTRRLTFECIAFFAYESKAICQTTLQAIKNAGLVLDGCLVITPDFRTNDPHIFAAGTCTKYQRKYYAENKKHKYYNQVEIGRKLANMLSGILIRAAPKDPFDVFRCAYSYSDTFVPDYVEPLYVSCVLPGGFNYFCVRNPGILSYLAIYSDGEFLTTGNPSNLKSQGYCRVHVNGYGIIDEIACLTKDPIEVINLTNVWGKHNILFKKMLTRYKVGQIKDFLKFFSGEEFQAIYNYMFPHLWDNITNMLLTKPVQMKPGTDMTEKMRKAYLIDDILHIYKINDERKFKKKHIRLIKALFSGSVYEENTVSMVLNFLEEHRAILPMYMHPLTIPITIAGYRDSGFFREKQNSK